MPNKRKIMIAMFCGALLLAACGTPTAAPQTLLPTPAMAITMTPAAISAGGLNITLLGVKMSDGYLEAEVCYQLPSQSDWFIGSAPDDVFITLNGENISYVGAGLIEFRADANGVANQRCDYIQFPVSKEQDLNRFTFTIQRLVTSQPEQPDCDKAQQKLNSSGIVIVCQHGDQAFTFNITQKPEGMSEEEAQRLVADAFTEIVTGPWIFETGLGSNGPSVPGTAPTPHPSSGSPAINGLIQSLNGIEMLIINLGINGATFTADVCYNQPATGYDWQLAASADDVNLSSAGQIAVLDSIQATGAEQNNAYTAANYRCVQLAFTLGPTADVSHVTITVKKAVGFTEDANCDRSEMRFDGGVLTFPRATGFTKCDAVSGYVEGPWTFIIGAR